MQAELDAVNARLQDLERQEAVLTQQWRDIFEQRTREDRDRDRAREAENLYHSGLFMERDRAEDVSSPGPDSEPSYADSCPPGCKAARLQKRTLVRGYSVAGGGAADKSDAENKIESLNRTGLVIRTETVQNGMLTPGPTPSVVHSDLDKLSIRALTQAPNLLAISPQESSYAPLMRAVSETSPLSASKDSGHKRKRSLGLPRGKPPGPGHTRGPRPDDRRHGHPTAYDSLGRPLFDRPSDGKLVYLQCDVPGCGVYGFKTVHGLMTHLSRPFQRGGHSLKRFWTQIEAVERCGRSPNEPVHGILSPSEDNDGDSVKTDNEDHFTQAASPTSRLVSPAVIDVSRRGSAVSATSPASSWTPINDNRAWTATTSPTESVAPDGEHLEGARKSNKRESSTSPWTGSIESPQTNPEQYHQSPRCASPPPPPPEPVRTPLLAAAE